MITQLYRHFDKNYNLLYVGISLNIVNRLNQHKNGSSWFSEISRIEIETFDTREKALLAETKAIKKENPKYNKKSKIFKLPIKFNRKGTYFKPTSVMKYAHACTPPKKIPQYREYYKIAQPFTEEYLNNLIDKEFKLLINKEPRLAELKNDIIKLMTTNPSHWIQRNHLWYHKFKPVFSRLLGFMAKNPELQSCEAYDIGYENLCRLLQIWDSVESAELVEFNRSQLEKLNSG